MKAFKEWFKTICDYRKKCDPTNKSVGCGVCESFRRQGWKAALNRVLKEYLNDPHLDVVDIVDWIRKELEESE